MAFHVLAFLAIRPSRRRTVRRRCAAVGLAATTCGPPAIPACSFPRPHERVGSWILPLAEIHMSQSSGLPLRTYPQGSWTKATFTPRCPVGVRPPSLLSSLSRFIRADSQRDSGPGPGAILECSHMYEWTFASQTCSVTGEMCVHPTGDRRRQGAPVMKT